MIPVCLITHLLYVAALWDYYVADEGSSEALRRLVGDSKNADCRWRRNEVGNDGVVRDRDELGWCFLDWSLELNKQAGAQGVLLYAMKSAVAIAKEIGKDHDAECIMKTYELYRKAAKMHFYDEEKGLFVSGDCRQISYASQVWMILGGVVDAAEWTSDFT